MPQTLFITPAEYEAMRDTLPSCARVLRVPTFHPNMSTVMARLREWLPELRVEDWTRRVRRPQEVPLISRALTVDPQLCTASRVTQHNLWMYRMLDPSLTVNDRVGWIVLGRKTSTTWFPIYEILLEGIARDGVRRRIRHSLLEEDDTTCPVCMQSVTERWVHNHPCEQCGRSWCAACHSRMTSNATTSMTTAGIVDVVCPLCRFVPSPITLVIAGASSSSDE